MHAGHLTLTREGERGRRTDARVESSSRIAPAADAGAANICYGIAAGRLNELSPKAVELMRTLIERSLRDFKPQEIANSVWAFATLKESHPAFFSRAGEEIEKRNLEGFDGQNVGNTIWAYAAMGLVKGEEGGGRRRAVLHSRAGD